MGQPQASQEVYTDLEKKSTNFVQPGNIFFNDIDQIINYVKENSFSKDELIKRLENTKDEGFTLYQP